MDKSEITVGDHATVFAGKDAIDLYRAKVLLAALDLNAKTGMLPTRGISAKKMLQMVTQFTGKKYKRTERDQAVSDLRTWCSAMQSALPVTRCH